MARKSAGLLLYRLREGQPEVLLVHPGGPFWKNKDEGAWSIPKGEVEPHEDLLEAALREFAEETGVRPEGPFVPLDPVQQKGGKVVHAWAVEGDLDPGELTSNTFELDWPPRSGRRQRFPEVDRAAFFAPDEAGRRINPGQAPLVEQLQRRLAHK
jgi:predicted NUDIX family NTP pyrophosphohydrolase